jgi:2'-5' RNA ligase
VRLFVAIDIPDAVRAALSSLVATLRPACGNARWTHIENAHATLKFIGEVPVERAEPVRAALMPIRSSASVDMIFRGVDFFPDAARPRVLWAGIESGPALGALASAVETALEPLGIPRERREFSPHLTLARFEKGGSLESLHQAIAAAGPLEFGRGAAREFHLYQSVLKRGGAEYTRLATYDFVEGLGS